MLEIGRETADWEKSIKDAKDWTVVPSKKKKKKKCLMHLFRSLDLCLPTYCRCRGYCCPWWNSRTHARAHTHTHARGRTSLDERSARRRDLYVTLHDTHKRWTSMTLAGFESAILGSERSQTHALDRAVTGLRIVYYYEIYWCMSRRMDDTK
jgi:hypothetical protein